MATAVQETASLPDMKVSIRQVFGMNSDMEVPAYSQADDHVPDIDPAYRFDRDHASHSGGFRLQPARDDSGVSRHRQVHAHRAGGRAPQLAVRARSTSTATSAAST